MSIIELYKKHINHNAEGSEIHNFFSRYNIGIEVRDPDPKLEAIRKQLVATRWAEAEKWIYKNSKITTKVDPQTESLTDSDFLKWIYDRLIYVYLEDKDTDYIIRLKNIADKLG